MREIKFRVYSPDWGGYIPFENNADIFSEIEAGSDGAISLEQYTGLKDKNEVEIYEGDIVLIKNVVDRGDGHFDDATNFVSMIDGCWAVCESENCYEELLCYICDELEVIGNIHENYELLEAV